MPQLVPVLKSLFLPSKSDEPPLTVRERLMVR